MDERRGFREPSMATYGAMAPPYEPNYPMPPDYDRAPLLPGISQYPEKGKPSGLMSPALAPALMAEGASLTNPALIIDGPTAPPSDWATIPGYEGMGGNHGGNVLPPPPMPDTGPTPASTSWLIPSISEDDARNALIEYSNGKCCYGSSPAKEMDFRELQAFNTYRYRLETFTESRKCDWVTAPFTGQPVDSSVFGVPPQPWDIPIQIPALFRDGEAKVPIPHTSSLKTCPQCLGTCRTVCKKCHGTGRVRCCTCNGTGNHFQESCNRCMGQGTVSCSICNCSRYVICAGCSGHGQILNFIELTVTWKNQIYEFVADHNSDFPTELFQEVTGEKIFVDENLLLSPLVAFPVASINQSSQFALQQHRTQFFSTSQVLRQRHSIQLLPLTKVEYVWRGKNCNYFVYGKEMKVYTDNYPQKCSCCVVM